MLDSAIKNAIDLAMDGIAILDNNGIFVYMNIAHATIFGYDSPSELIGKSWIVLYENPEVLRIKHIVFPQLLESGLWTGETTGKKKDGAIIYQDVRLSIWPQSGIVCISRDITNKKEISLRLSHLDSFVKNTQTLIMLTDADKRITWVNESFEKKFGYSLGELRGKKAAILQGAETSAKTAGEISQSLRSKKTFSGEILNYSKSGQKIWIFLEIMALADAAGKLTGFMSVQSDISVLKLAEQKIKSSLKKERELNSIKTHLINMAAHQFRTPLAVIQASTELLSLEFESKNLSENIKNSNFTRLFFAHVNLVNQQIKHLTHLMDYLNTTHQLRSGQNKLKKTLSSLKAFLTNFSSMQVDLFQRSRKLTFEFKAPDVPFFFDPSMLHTALQNLVTNAFKYSQDKLQPEMKVLFKENSYLIEIKDYGTGIPPAELHLISQPFFRGSNAVNSEGMGLGFLISKTIIEMHGGTLEIINNSDAGCTVAVKLPVNIEK